MKARKWLRIVVFGLVALATLAALGITVVSYRARKEWAQIKAELLARGEKLSFAELVPEAHMDERNFFFDPIWMELLDTKPVVSDSRIEVAEPKVPKGKRQLDQIDGEIPAELKKKIFSLLPESERRSGGLTVSDLKSFANRELLFIQSPEQKRELSRLILEAIRGSETLRGRIEELLSRPEAAIPYDPAWGIANPRDTSDYVYKMGWLYGSIALAHYGAGDYRASAGEIRHLLLLAGVLQSDPFYFAVNARLSFAAMAKRLIAEGIKDRIWSDEELEEFERMLRVFDFPADAARSFRAERGAFNQFIEEAMKDGRGRDIWEGGEGYKDLSFVERRVATWSYPYCLAMDQTRFNRFNQLVIEGLERHEGSVSASVSKLEKVNFPWRGFHVLSISRENFFLGNLDFLLLEQDEISRARISCALERYLMAKGRYPEKLDKLVPEYLPEIPRCVIPQRSFSWSRNGGNYHLKLTGTDDMIFLNGPL